MNIRSRIAPTPSGYLHAGNALNFVLTWLWVRKQNGILRLRIDDLDVQRARPEYLHDIFDTLRWLELDWDEGPVSVQDHLQHYSQTLFTSRYNQLFAQLASTGKVFACTCSRSMVRGQYNGTCLSRGLPLDTPDAAWRVITPEPCIITVPDARAGSVAVNLYDVMRHFVIRRRDGYAAYQVASLADDLANGTNLVVRGADLLHSTAAQIYLAQLAGHSGFAQAVFYHHPLLTGDAGEKLSKSAGSTALKAWREEGRSAEEFYRWMTGLLRWKRTATSAHEMLAELSSLNEEWMFYQ